MKIAVLGTGSVGQAIASRLIQVGHEVRMGSRTADNKIAQDWVSSMGHKASHGSFAHAAAFSELVFLCTKGEKAIEALKLAEPINLENKILVDVTNALIFEKDKAPYLSPEFSNTTSVAEEIQKAFPTTKVVKSLNTMWGGLMVNPLLLHEGEHDVFTSGNSEDAKLMVRTILMEFGWKEANIIDLGDISTARGPEMYVSMWIQLRLMKGMNDNRFNIRLVRE